MRGGNFAKCTQKMNGIGGYTNAVIYQRVFGSMQP